MYGQVEMSLLGVNNVVEQFYFFSFRLLVFSPLFIQGMFYCWSCDLAKKLPQTSRGNVYIMIMIQHFSN
jgi:hypothetical protein